VSCRTDLFATPAPQPEHDPWRRRILVHGWACALTGCFISHMHTVSAGPTGISLKYDGTPYEYVLSAARQHCAEFGKIAWPTANESVDDGYGHLHGHIQHLDCRDQAPGAPS
jgi:hypothetical protein